MDYAELLPSLFELKAGNFYVALAGEPDRVRVLRIIRKYVKPDQRVFVGVVAPIDPRIETPEEVRDRILEAAEHIPLEQLGTTDDCGFSPFSDDDVDEPRHRVREDPRAGARHRARGRAAGGEVMQAADDEDGLLRSVAMQNAQSHPPRAAAGGGGAARRGRACCARRSNPRPTASW